ncbi:bifunctional glycosyltransferase/class I SAM-dependent methyltransferase [Janibacter melonis]|uniref:bifunctional glycosyltransferase/class I SAM-dependent methyltransferase n=1 Tax=Janibacter melonis TaxID=262209 RepID=UPI001E507F24|nr:bifunctional glycosyltransferase/class I SAM-dependent methyltransferase [Janibacter melonis]
MAYNAERTLATTLDRLPPSFRKTVDHVLLADDASQDGTYEIGRAYQSSSELPMTVVKHPKNLGYGGNQKAGYAWAISHGLDVVVLLHGDGQYAPEVIESLVDPVVRGEANAVFGSRMLVKGGALDGGMPLYKFVGNRILSTAQNRLTGLGLSEWHSGYRAYSVKALAKLDLQSYSDDFDFDTEIILGLHGAGFTITEVPIPTYYGDEICHVNGMRYAKDVVVDVLAFRASRMGFGHRGTVVDPNAYQMKPSKRSSHGRLLAWLAASGPGKVLDVGCSDGRFGAAARALGHEVHGVDIVTHEGVTNRIDAFFEADLAAGLPEQAHDDYSTIVAGDVLEHVVDPGALLDQMVERLAPSGHLLISVPNISHWYPRGRIAVGRFDYDSRGPLDEGHLRFFTRRTIEQLLSRHGLRVVESATVGAPVDVVDRAGPRTLTTSLVRRLGRIDHAAAQAWPTMFGYQLLYKLERAA